MLGPMYLDQISYIPTGANTFETADHLRNYLNSFEY